MLIIAYGPIKYGSGPVLYTPALIGVGWLLDLVLVSLQTRAFLVHPSSI